MEDKVTQEVKHGTKIARNAEVIWGWDTPAGQIRAARRGRYFIELGGITAGAEALELGCGTGVFTEKIAKTGVTLTAIDISSDLLNKAKEALAGANIRFGVENAEKLSFGPESFDIVFGSSILHHLNLESALDEIRRILKKGGRLVFTEPNMLNPQILIERNIRAIGRALGNSPSETAFTRWKMTRALEAQGFKSVSVVPFDFLHPWTPARLIPLVSAAGGLIERTPLLKEIAGSLVISAQKGS